MPGQRHEALQEAQEGSLPKTSLSASVGIVAPPLLRELLVCLSPAQRPPISPLGTLDYCSMT